MAMLPPGLPTFLAFVGLVLASLVGANVVPRQQSLMEEFHHELERQVDQLKLVEASGDSVPVSTS